ncbi:DUF547 domain-containing protein [Olleya sp. AS48]|uniref:DUF547 domain-containing protein n=1 Tax=Olleya sp. AS48 TaxID=3135774 RepID=UPI00316FF11B
MKQLLALALLVLFCACKSTKQTVQNTQIATNTIKKEAIAEIKMDTINKTNDSSYIIKKAKYLITEDVKIAEYDLVDKRQKFISNKKDSIPKNNEFNQILTKTEHSNIHFLWNELLQKHVSANGNVNYKSFKTDYKKLLEYINILAILKSKPEFDSISKEEKLAFWINAYNALTIDLIIKNYPVKSIKDIKDPWEQRLWQFGDKWYNLEDIEHKILRKMDEPRIHFAIVCASYSCPKLQNSAFTADNLEQQLTLATQEFLSDTNRNEIFENALKLSKIFKWFDKDFEQNGSLIDFLNKYTAITISAKAKISYKDYNWDLND